MVCSLKLLILLQSVVLHKVIAMENRKLQIEENNLHKQLFHYETLKKSDISLHVRHHRDVDTGHVTARTYVTFFTLGMNFSMVLKVGSPVVAPGLRAYTVDRNGKYEPLHVDSNDFLTGHLKENESMHVYAHYEEDILCTTVYFPKETYFTEPSWRHLPSSSGWDLISYRLSDVNWNHTGPFSDPITLLQRPSSDESVSSDEQHQRFSRIRQKRQNNVLKKKCSLRLVADYSFYSQYAKFSASEAIKIMVSSIAESNRIFEDTKWKTAESLGWGFVIKQVLVHTEYSKGPMGGPFSYNYEVDHWNTLDKLYDFSLHGDIMQFCLAHLFTTTLFKDDRHTLGLAYLGSKDGDGGICADVGEDFYPRTGWTTTLYRNGEILAGIQFKRTTAHEFGHNWGSSHDPIGECSLGDEDGGGYIMSMVLLPGDQRNNDRFSPCSIDSISLVMKSMSQKCFIESDKEEIPCGNGVVEIREQCDAGPDGLEGKDKCCSSICLLRENARCSDFNSKCCRNCQAAPAGTKCGTDPDSQCIKSATCDGVEHSCPAVPLADGTACQDSRVCFGGKCLSSCEVLEKKNGKTYEPCQCQEEINACKNCCKEVLGNKKYGSCIPTETSLGSGEPCYKGLCNEKGKCVSEKEEPCGNGVLDENEECDAGEEIKENQHKCCNSTCHLRASGQCSGVSEPCCKDCKITQEGTVCGDPNEHPCWERAKCDGVSADCPVPELKENGIACHGEGRCVYGRCITKDCKELGKKNNRLYRACMCDSETDACKHCCQEDLGNKIYGPCFPTETPLGFREPCYNGVCNEKGKCVPEKDIPCGNGVLDTEEECDAGEESLKNQDKCCNSTCHLKESTQCSGFNKPCCKDCKIAPKGTDCESNFDLPCMESAKCDGVSTDCPSAVPKENGIGCRGQGQCINGRCITTYCKELGEKDNRRYRACMCNHDASAACKRCCLEVFDNNTNGPCFPTNKTLRPGQLCYNGECNEKGLCIPLEGLFTVRLFKFFNNLDFDTLAETMKTNLVMTVVFLTALFWIPISCCISCMDRKKRKHVSKYSMAREEATTEITSSVDYGQSYKMWWVNREGSSVDPPSLP